MNRRGLMLLLAGAMTAARAVRAQQKPLPVIGYLGGATLGTNASFVAAFRRGLSETGHVDGQNLATEYRWAEGQYYRLPALAADLVSRNVDVIAANGHPFSTSGETRNLLDPDHLHLRRRPGRGGAGGQLRPAGRQPHRRHFHHTELVPKRLELLTELVPQAKVIALLVNPHSPNTELIMRDVQEAARAKGVQLDILKASTESDIDGAFATLVHLHAGALIVGTDAFFFQRRDQLVALASRHAVPAIYDAREFAAAGGLISYGRASLAHPPGRHLRRKDP